jgi:hypothetical protein
MQIFMGGPKGGGTIKNNTPGWNVGRGFSGTLPEHELPPGTEEFIPWQSRPQYRQASPALQPSQTLPTPTTPTTPYNLSSLNPKYNLLDEYKNTGV